MAMATDLNLTVGQKLKIPTAKGEPIHISGGQFVSAEDLGTSVELFGKAAGVAHVKISNREYKVFVGGATHHGLFSALNDCTKELLGLQTTQVGAQIIVTGELHRLQDWERLAEVASAFSAEYVFRARIDEDIKGEVLQRLRQKITAHNLPMPNFLFVPSSRAIIAEEFKSLNLQWSEVLAPFGIERLYEKSALAIQPLVRVNIVVAEINKVASQKIGIEWPDSASAQISPAFSGPNQVLLTLHALEHAGLGQILASPNLLARSGSEAEFLAGGELPIKVENRYVHEVVWKRHGIYLKIKPIADFSGKLSIELTTEVSIPDKIYDGIPSLKSNKISTHFDLSEPQTIVLSGLIRNNWGENTDGLPYLSQIPVIGRLFGSKDYMSSKTELVIFVTPQIVNTNDEKHSVTLPSGWRPQND